MVEITGLHPENKFVIGHLHKIVSHLDISFNRKAPPFSDQGDSARALGFGHKNYLPRIIPKTPVFRLGMKAISNPRIKKSPVL
jgi:hypothetical protein